MVATVQIREKNGSGETATDKTSGTLRFKNADNSTVDTSDPLIIPSTTQNYSYQKFLRLYIGATGPTTSITNLVFYTDGVNSYGTGVKLWADTRSSYPESGQSAPVVPANTDDPPHFNDGGGDADMTNAFTYTSASGLSLGAGPYSTTTSDMGDYLILVLEAEAGASQGALSSETLTFAYDES